MAESLCLVTGGAGFLGRHVVRRLRTEGVRVRVLTRREQGRKEGILEDSGVEVCRGDIGDSACLARALEDVSDVIHLACTTVPVTSQEDPSADLLSNGRSTLALLQACAARHVRRFVFPSSGGTVYGTASRPPVTEEDPTRPISAHGAMKLSLEAYVGMFHQTQGLDSVILRIANAYGPGQDPLRPQGIVGVFLDRLLRGASVTMAGGGDGIRDFVYAEDVADAFARARVIRSSCRVFNIGTGQGTRVREILTILESETGRRARIEITAPNPFDVPANWLDIARAREHLGWRPAVSLAEGLRCTVSAVQGRPRPGG